MDIEKLIEQLNGYFEGEKLRRGAALDAATALSTLQTENERLRAAVDNWKKKYVEANGKWIEAENKWAGLDKAVRNGTVYRPMQEELNLTHEENQSLKDAIEKLRAELEQVKRERDTALCRLDAVYET
jgi:FtsZ-binding cell division protein ZapB